MQALQKQILEDKLAHQSQSTVLLGGSASGQESNQKQNGGQGGVGIRGIQRNQARMLERPYHDLHCGSKNCKDQLHRHVLSFYHKDGYLDIQVSTYKKQNVATADSKNQGITDSPDLHFEDIGTNFDDNSKSASRYMRKKNVRTWDSIFVIQRCKKCGFMAK